MPKGIAHVLLFTGFLLSILLLLPVNAEESESPSTTVSGETPSFTECEPTVPPDLLEPDDVPYKLYLPIIAKPAFAIIGGELRLHTSLHTNNDRHKGLTFFITDTIFLSYSDVHFSYPYQHQPVKARVYYDHGYCIQTTFTETNHHIFLRGLDAGPITVGVNHVTVEFELGSEHGSATATMPFTFFYIPNGDFEGVSTEGWLLYATLTSPPPSGNPSPLEPRIKDKKLLLDSFAERHCNQAYRSITSASLPMQVPPHSSYKLRIRGTVYTQDLNPSNTATYDSFEIAINNQLIERYSNQQSPINCSNPHFYRQLPVDIQIPLNNYAGSIVLSLENHLRYDHYFYTYTEIDMVWIDK